MKTYTHMYIYTYAVFNKILIFYKEEYHRSLIFIYNLNLLFRI